MAADGRIRDAKIIVALFRATHLNIGGYFENNTSKSTNFPRGTDSRQGFVGLHKKKEKTKKNKGFVALRGPGPAGPVAMTVGRWSPWASLRSGKRLDRTPGVVGGG